MLEALLYSKPNVKGMGRQVLVNLQRVVVVVALFLLVSWLVQPYIHSEKTYTPKTLRIGVLPDDSEAALRQRHSSLIEYLSEQLVIQVELIIPNDYPEIVALFGRGELDLAYFGGLTFVQAQARHGAQPLVMRDIDERFSSLLFTHPQHTAHTLSDFKGGILLFGSQLSTSGHLMPRHFLQKQLKKDVNQHFSNIQFSGNHHNTVVQVLSGKADLGAVNSEIIQTMLRDGRILEDDIRVIEQTPPYTNYVWAVPDNLAEKTKNQLRDAFLRLGTHDKLHQDILTQSGASRFLPANNRDFKQLKNIADQVNMLNPEGNK